MLIFLNQPIIVPDRKRAETLISLSMQIKFTLIF